MEQKNPDMDIKCIALDLDGTTLMDANRLSDVNRDALLRVLDRGVEVVVASGRPRHSLPESVTGIEGVNYAITSNGSEVYDLRSGECLKRAILDERAVDLIMREGGKHDVAVEVFIEGQAYCSLSFYEDPTAYGVPAEYRHYITSTRIPCEDIDGFIRGHLGEYGNIDFIVKDVAVGTAIRKEFREYGGMVYVTSSTDSRVEFGAVDSGKNKALKFVTDHLKIDRNQVAAFGNADNDAEMLQFAGIGIAVADSSLRCLKAADYVTKACREDGVAWAIDNILML